MVDKIWQKLLTGVMAIYYANSPGYGTDFPLSWTDGSPNLPDKMDFWAFLCFSWKFCPFFCFSFWAIFAPKTLTKRPPPSMQAIFFMKGELFEGMFLISFVLQGRIQDFFRRGCTRLFLYFNTNKPQFFFCRIPVALENCRSSQGGGVRTPCTLLLDLPLYWTPFSSPYIILSRNNVTF